MHLLRCASWLAVPIFALTALPALADVYRCQQANGSATYQDTPCATGTQKKVDSPASGSSPVIAASPIGTTTDYKPVLAELDRKRLVREAIATGVPMVSMTRAELNNAMGSPDKINSGEYGPSSQDQLIYYRQGRTWYVYTKDGLVAAIENTQGVPAAARRKPCPSASEIRRLEVEISKFMNRDKQQLQAELHRQLAEAKACQ